MYRSRIFFIISLCFAFTTAFAQTYSHQDSLLGWLNTYRACYDVVSYDVVMQLDFETQRIAASNRFFFRATRDFQTLQFELAKNLKIAKILYHGKNITPARDGDATFITFPNTIKSGQLDSFRVFYVGTPQIAKNPPWDGGLVWSKDSSNKPWIGVACQNVGAHVWLPVKGHLSDEPDSVDMRITVPSNYTAVSNGKLISSFLSNGNNITYHWHTSYPINTYNITFNIGEYAHITDTYENASGKHELDYYVLWRHSQKVKDFLIPQTKKMLQCFEQYFGEYPFWRDGYGLVEAPFWGMEHQGAIAYNNHFLANEFGFDFILVHESGHEWFGNSLSMNDRCDMWIHETFTTYAEAVYVEHYGNKQQAVKYLLTQAKRIENKQAMITPCNMANFNLDDIDIYFKGTWMLHTLREMVNHDALWWQTLKRFAETYRLQHLTTDEVISFFNKELGKDYTWFFHHYLKTTDIPQLEYKLTHKKRSNTWAIQYRWNTADKDFVLPLEVETQGNLVWRKRIFPTTEWKTEEITGEGNVSALQVVGEEVLYHLKQLDTQVAVEAAPVEKQPANPETTKETKPKKEKKKKRKQKEESSEEGEK